MSSLCIRENLGTRTGTVPGSGFQVPGSCAKFRFGVLGSEFEGSKFVCAHDSCARRCPLPAPGNPEHRTSNSASERRTRTRNQELGTWNVHSFLFHIHAVQFLSIYQT